MRLIYLFYLVSSDTTTSTNLQG